MSRFLLVGVTVLTFGAAAQAGGPPPVYVVVDKVVLEPNADAPERIRIEGSFIRQEVAPRYAYGKPVQGYVYLSIEVGKQAECRAEWAKWQKAAGTGKAVSVGSCGDAGSLLTTRIRRGDERADQPDAAYTTGRLERFGHMYAGGDWEQESPVRDLLAFVKARKPAEPASRR